MKEQVSVTVIISGAINYLFMKLELHFVVCCFSVETQSDLGCLMIESRTSQAACLDTESSSGAFGVALLSLLSSQANTNVSSQTCLTFLQHFSRKYQTPKSICNLTPDYLMKESCPNFPHCKPNTFIMQIPQTEENELNTRTSDQVHVMLLTKQFEMYYVLCSIQSNRDTQIPHLLAVNNVPLRLAPLPSLCTEKMYSNIIRC